MKLNKLIFRVTINLNDMVMNDIDRLCDALQLDKQDLLRMFINREVDYFMKLKGLKRTRDAIVEQLMETGRLEDTIVVPPYNPPTKKGI